MKKSILIDASHLEAVEPTGVEAATAVVLPLLSSELLSRGWEVAWVTPRQLQVAPAGVEVVVVPYTKFWGERAVRSVLPQYGLYFTMSGIAPLFTRVPRVMFLHDVAFMRFPKVYRFGQIARLRWWMPLVAKRCRALITPVRVVKDDIRQFWGIEKVSVVPFGQLPLSDKEVQPSSVPLGARYALFVGRLEAKKNLAPVIAAFAAQQDSALYLVLAGKPGFGYASITKAVASLPVTVRERVVVTGYVSEPERSWLVRHAAVMVVPSPGEGFAFPILDGFAAGVPVLGANMGATAETGGEGMIHVAPTSEVEWAEAFDKVLTDSEVREALIAQGAKQLRAYAWPKTVASIADVLDAALAE